MTPPFSPPGQPSVAFPLSSPSPGGPWRPLQFLAAWGGYSIFGVIGLLVSVLCFLLHAALRERGHAFGRRLIRALFAFFTWYVRLTRIYRMEFRGLEALQSQRGVIFAANHPSLMDAVFLIGRLPETVCITKSKNWANPVLGGTARLAGYIRNDSHLDLMHQSRQRLLAGENLLVFPEGTRTVGAGPVNPFKSGFALMAKVAAAPVQTLFIRLDPPDYLGKGWPFFKVPPLPVLCAIEAGALLKPAPGEQARDFSRRVEAYFREALAPQETSR